MYLPTKNLIAGISLAGLLSACAALPPPQLVEARNAYATSSRGTTAKMAPTELYEAKKTLSKANQEFEANGDTDEVRDYAYIASRKIALADVSARTEMNRRAIAEAVKQGIAVRDQQVESSKDALANTRGQLEDARDANVAQGQELNKTAAQLDAEKRARMTAEAQLAGAMKDLATIAAVRQEARGVVITLSGSVLFASGEHALLETAKTKLNQVAEALKAQSDDKKIVIEGHTDTQGNDAINNPLSVKRANAVRDYLVERGVDSGKVSAVGLGSSRPIVNNGTAENRANNRRVEIIIQPGQESKVSTR